MRGKSIKKYLYIVYLLVIGKKWEYKKKARKNVGSAHNASNL